MTLVSVCMATYNGAKYIREQVDSILNQEFVENEDVELEIVVSDDGSTDGTLQILESYQDARIKFYHHTNHKKYKYFKANRMASANFENALSQARGEYIFLADQDDVWMPFKIDKSLTVLRQYGGTVAAAFYFGDENLKKGQTMVYDHHIPFFSPKAMGIYGFSMGFAREELKYFLPIPSHVAGHDKYFQYSAMWRKSLRFVDVPSAIHRWSGVHNLTSFGQNNMKPPLLVQVYFRLVTYLSVIYRSVMVRPPR